MLLVSLTVNVPPKMDVPHASVDMPSTPLFKTVFSAQLLWTLSMSAVLNAVLKSKQLSSFAHPAHPLPIRSSGEDNASGFSDVNPSIRQEGVNNAQMDTI